MHPGAIEHSSGLEGDPSAKQVVEGDVPERSRRAGMVHP